MDLFEGIVEPVKAFILANQAWAGPIVFLLAFGESLAFVSLLFPATVLMVFVGVLISQGVLDFWWMVLWAFPGAAMGDWVSFWIGKLLKDRIAHIWPFTRHPDMLDKGHAFFHRFGVASVFLGRFFGPVRAVIPVIAGIMDMPSGKFQLANWSSALIWAVYWLGVGLVGDQAFVWVRQKFGLWGGLAVIAVIVAVAWLGWRWWQSRRKTA